MQNKEKTKKEELVELTKKLVEFKTKTGDIKEINACFDFIKTLFPGDKYVVQEFEHNNVRSMFVGYSNNRNPRLMLNGHIDVVDANDEQFIPTIKDDKIYGRGTIDMKGGVAALILLLKEFEKEKPSIGLMIVSDEEIGGFNGTKYLVEEEGFSAEFVIGAEPNQSKDAEKLFICTKEKGSLWIKIRTKGVSCHASRPWLGDNAIDKLLRKYLEIRCLFNLASKYDQWKTTINAGKIEAGSSPNKVPDVAELTLDIRFTEKTNIEEILEKIKTVEDIEVEEIVRGALLYNDNSNKYIQKLKKVTEEVTGKEVELISEHGASDLRFFSLKQIPSVIFGPWGENYHGIGEYISIKSLELYFNVTKKFIEEEFL